MDGQEKRELEAKARGLRGKYSALLRQLIDLGDGVKVRITPPLSVSQESTLRSTGRYNHCRIRVRNKPDATIVWLDGECEGFEKYRGHNRTKPAIRHPEVL